ncbi:MAG: alpha/beta hydrolase [Acidobacteriia bacterium]|nr:alpha/beta hydrolase [Terriglobia bacterium]
MAVHPETQEGAERAPASFEVAGQRLEYRWIGPRPAEAPTIVFLHEGLGCAGMWRNFPDRVARETGCGALVYSRRGYGASDAVRGSRPVRFMHDEAIQILPLVIERFELSEVILFGHSDGASIAIIYAGIHPDSVCGLVLEAPHVFVEPVCIESISRVAKQFCSNHRAAGQTRDQEPSSQGPRIERTTLQKCDARKDEMAGLRNKLERYHGDNTESMFKTWTEVWLNPEFRQWNIEDYLPRVQAPILVIQGEQDEYGTLKQVDAIVTQARGPVESLVMADCGHSPHRDQPERVILATVQFILRIVNP